MLLYSAKISDFTRQNILSWRRLETNKLANIFSPRYLNQWDLFLYLWYHRYTLQSLFLTMTSIILMMEPSKLLFRCLCATTGWSLHLFDISVVQFTLTHGDYYHSKSLWKMRFIYSDHSGYSSDAEVSDVCQCIILICPNWLNIWVCSSPHPNVPFMSSACSDKTEILFRLLSQLVSWFLAKAGSCFCPQVAKNN